MTTIRVTGFVLLLSAALVGCNEAPPSEPYVHETQINPPGPEFRLSPEAARWKEQATPIAEPAPPETETPVAEPRRKTVIESLFQAVRQGAAEALDEGAAEN